LPVTVAKFAHAKLPANTYRFVTLMLE